MQKDINETNKGREPARFEQSKNFNVLWASFSRLVQNAILSHFRSKGVIVAQLVERSLAFTDPRLELNSWQFYL